MADPERIGPAPWADGRMRSEGSKDFGMISKGATEMGLDRAPPALGPSLRTASALESSNDG